jgi:hypothetical protein
MNSRLSLLSFGCLFVLIVNACPFFVFADEDSIAVKKLNIYLEQAEEDARRSRVWGGGILLGLGAAAAVGGVVTAGVGTSAEIPISLGVSAVVLGGLGALIRSSPTDQETVPPQFREMAETTPEKMAEKRLLGESYLSIFGHQAERNRIFKSTLRIVLGTTLIGWYAAENQGRYQTVNSFLLYEGAVLGALGIVGLFVQTDLEVALKDYTEFKKGSSGVLSTLKSTMKFGVYPISGGGIANLSFSF